MIRRSEQVKRATCAIVSMVECALIGLALWSAHSSGFSSVGLAFAAGMVLVILFLLIIEKADDAKAIDHAAVAVAGSGGIGAGTAGSTFEEETRRRNGSGSLLNEFEQPMPTVR